jgi:hypothetical protein
MTQTKQAIPTEYALLNRWLTDIFNLGDCDEMSWKHVGHGMAALLATDNWREAVDYRLPDEVLFPEEEQKLEALWDCVKDIMNKKGKQWVLDGLPILSAGNWKMLYANTYVDSSWMGYAELIEKQNLEVRREL